jgi:GNAT superfamily N-acetyltransferase
MEPVGIAGRIARLHRDTALEAFAGIFPPEAPPPTLAALTADWAARLAAPPPHVVLVAEEDARLVGVVAAGPDPDDATAGHLSRLYVTPPSWGRGIGRSLHDRALAHLRAQSFPRPASTTSPTAAPSDHPAGTTGSAWGMAGGRWRLRLDDADLERVGHPLTGHRHEPAALIDSVHAPTAFGHGMRRAVIPRQVLRGADGVFEASRYRKLATETPVLLVAASHQLHDHEAPRGPGHPLDDGTRLVSSFGTTSAHTQLRGCVRGGTVPRTRARCVRRVRASPGQGLAGAGRTLPLGRRGRRTYATWSTAQQAIRWVGEKAR